MRELIENFCEDIKEEYITFLKTKSVKYYEISADIITSYLNLVTNKTFEYIYVTNYKEINHAWTYYKDEYDKFIIDFTGMQIFYNKNIDTKEIKVIFSADDAAYRTIKEITWATKRSCYGTIEDFKGTLNKNDFIEYANLAYNQILAKKAYNQGPKI